jgi:hypothetical protein
VIKPGSHQKTCYACGEKGHFKGDDECKAGPNDIWSGAPEGWKSRAKGVARESPRKEKERVKNKEELPLEIAKGTKGIREKAAKPLANISLQETAIANSVTIVV